MESSRQLEQELEAALNEVGAIMIIMNDTSIIDLSSFLDVYLLKVKKENKDISLQLYKNEEHFQELTRKHNESQKSLSRLQTTIQQRDETINSLTNEIRKLEQIHETVEEKLRQVEFTEKQTREQRDEFEENYVLLLCEVEGTIIVQCALILFYRELLFDLMK